MTEIETTAGGLGRRIASYRKYLGYASTRDLADAIANPKVTESVLQNIESGRKSDISVSQLIDISVALNISPLFLLVPIGRPMDKLDLTNLGDESKEMTASQFSAWLCVADDTVPGEGYERGRLRFIYKSMNRLISEVKRWRDLVDDPDLHADPVDVEVEPGRFERYDPAAASQAYLDATQRTIDMLCGQLSAYNVDLSWVPRPWRENVPNG